MALFYGFCPGGENGHFLQNFAISKKKSCTDEAPKKWRNLGLDYIGQNFAKKSIFENSKKRCPIFVRFFRKF